MAYNGYLIKFLGSGGTSAVLPLKYIRYSTYKISPEQRLNLDPTRDTLGYLHRNVLQHTATKIEFNIPRMTNTELEGLLTILRQFAITELTAEFNIEYFSPRTNSYHTGRFYLPDTIDFPIRNIDEENRIINYEEIRLAFIEM